MPEQTQTPKYVCPACEVNPTQKKDEICTDCFITTLFRNCNLLPVPKDQTTSQTPNPEADVA